jgi:hypothetical protein
MSTNRIVRFMVSTALASAAASAFAGQITLFENPNYQGRYVATADALPSLEATVMNRTASSMVIGEGSWEACTEPNFHGRCARFNPGSYNGLGGEFSGVIASVRQIGTDAALPQAVINQETQPIAMTPGLPVVAATQPNDPGDTRIVLYDRNSGGYAVELTSNFENLDRRHFDKRVNAAYVTGGVWRLCDGDKGRGYCSEFAPGRYESLGRLDGRVSSAYIVSPAPARVAVTGPDPWGRMVLYQYPNFAGPSATVERKGAPDLDWAKFKDRAASLRVESGTWLVCSNIGYEGECRVVGPGSYPQLSGVLSQGIYSARQIWRPDYSAAEYRRP